MHYRGSYCCNHKRIVLIVKIISDLGKINLLIVLTKSEIIFRFKAMVATFNGMELSKMLFMDSFL